MSIFLQTAGAVLIAGILGLILSSQDKSMGLLLILAVCIMVLMLAVHFLGPVIDFLQQLQQIGTLQEDYMQILYKITAISVISEICGMICSDSGNPALGKALHYLAAAVILWLSIPVFQGMLDMIQEILVGI